MLLAYNLADVGYVLLGGHEVGQVACPQLVETAWYDGVLAALDGHHVVGVVGAAELAQGLVQDFCRLAQLDA